MKKNIFVSILLIAGLILSSCGDNDDDKDVIIEREEDTGKELFSTWVRTTDGFLLDLRQGRLNTIFEISFIFRNGAICTCNGRLLGTETGGTTSLASCTYTGSGAGDPGCSSIDAQGIYTKDQDSLQICDPECSIFN